MATRRWLLPLFLLLPATALHGQDVPLPENFCLPQTEAALASVLLGAPSSDLLKAFGPPARRSTRTGKDADGTYQVQQLVYPHLSADVGRDDRLERLATADSAVATPSGIHVGLTGPQVLQRLGLPSRAALPARSWSPAFCNRGPLIPGKARIVFVFTPLDARAPSSGEPRLQRIEMVEIGS